MRRARGVAALALVIAASMAGCRRAADQAPADGRTPVWLDLSPSYGEPARDPGDAMALLQAYGSGRLSVRGVSVTFGNVPLERGFPVAQELMKRLDTGLLRPWRGPSTPEERAAPTEATELLTEAMGKQRLTIVALGPVTTVASVLLRKPALGTRIERVVIVGGRSEVATIGDTPRRGDANVMADAGSLRVLLDSQIPITLVQAGPSTGLGLDSAALDRMPSDRGPLSLVIPAARAWLGVVRSGGNTSFPVPAMLAVDVVAHPGELRCDLATARLRNDTADHLELLVSAAPDGGRRVTWCHSADADAKPRILADLARVPAR